MSKKDTPPSADAKARVLVACAWGQPNDVVTVSAEEAAAGKEAGELDPDPAAVAYAESLAAPKEADQ